MSDIARLLAERIARLGITVHDYRGEFPADRGPVTHVSLHTSPPSVDLPEASGAIYQRRPLSWTLSTDEGERVASGEFPTVTFEFRWPVVDDGAVFDCRPDDCWRCDAAEATTGVGLCADCSDDLGD